MSEPLSWVRSERLSPVVIRLHQRPPPLSSCGASSSSRRTPHPQQHPHQCPCACGACACAYAPTSPYTQSLLAMVKTPAWARCVWSKSELAVQSLGTQSSKFTAQPCQDDHTICLYMCVNMSNWNVKPYVYRTGRAVFHPKQWCWSSYINL